MGAEFFEELFVGPMLFASFGQIDRLPCDEGQLAIHDGGTDGASDGGEHIGWEVYTRTRPHIEGLIGRG